MIYERLARAWEHKAKRLDYRCLKSLSFSIYGRGSSYITLRKHNDIFYVGSRRWYLSIEEYPNLVGHKENYCNINSGNEIKYLDRLPPEKHHQKLWLVATPERTYIPRHIDSTCNNFLHGLGLGHAQQYSHPNTLIRTTNFGFCMYRTNNTLYQHGVILDNRGRVLEGLGAVIENPCVQIYDQGLFNKGLKSFWMAQKLLTVYGSRHDVLQIRKYPIKWFPDELWALFHLFQDNNNVSPAQLAAVFGDEKLSIIPKPVIRAIWLQEGLKYGFARIVPKGTPRYTEVPQYAQQPEPDHASFFLGH